MSADALRAAATQGRSLKPVERIQLKLSSITEQLQKAVPATMSRVMTPERMIRLFWQEARRVPSLLKCDPETVASALMTSTQLGLEIGIAGQGYIVPYWNNRRGVMEAQFIPGYKGLISLARRTGEVQAIETNIVYMEDEFELTLGIAAQMRHIPYLDGDRGAPRLVYGVARFKDGGHHFEWMTIAEVERIRKRSKSSEIGPWATDYDQMVRKTLIRRMANYLPMSVELVQAFALADAADEGKRAVIAGEFVETEDTDAAEDGDASNDAPKPEPEQRRSQRTRTRSDAPKSAPGAPTVKSIIEDLKAASSLEELDLIADQARSMSEEDQQLVAGAISSRRQFFEGAKEGGDDAPRSDA